MKLDPFLSVYFEINSRWIKDLNYERQIFKTWENIEDFSFLPCAAGQYHDSKDLCEMLLIWQQRIQAGWRESEVLMIAGIPS